MKNRKISPERMLELEEIISNNVNIELFEEEEQHYIKLAQALPLNDIIDLLLYYKKNASYTDEVKFFCEIQKKYSLSESDTELRIKDAHKIMRYVKKMAKKNMTKQKLKKLF